MPNVYVFRIADNDFVRNELKQGRLRQGWGDSNSNLLSTNNQLIPAREWVDSKCAKEVFENNRKYYTSKYRNLSKMTDIAENDIIVIPKAPDYSCFTICRAAGTYSFTEPIGFGGDDYFHTIPIDTSSMRVFNYHADENCEIIHAKLRAYQSPINNVWNKLFIAAAQLLIDSDANTEEESIDNIVKGIKDEIYKSSIDRFRALGNRATEKIVNIIFEKLGYVFINRNSPDREGGDADLIFADNSFSELMDIGVNSGEVSGKVYVQIKNKSGTDYSDVNGVYQLIQRCKDEPNATKILISTVDKFTPECITLANKNNVLLINGNGFSKLVFKYID